MKAFRRGAGNDREAIVVDLINAPRVASGAMRRDDDPVREGDRGAIARSIPNPPVERKRRPQHLADDVMKDKGGRSMPGEWDEVCRREEEIAAFERATERRVLPNDPRQSRTRGSDFES